MLLTAAIIVSATACSGSPAETTSTTTTTAATTEATTTTAETTTAEATTTEAETTTAETTATEAETTTEATTTTAETTTTTTTTTAATTPAPAVDKVRTELSNPNANETTKKIYAYIMDMQGKGIISGQQESTWMGSPEYEMDYIHDASGEYPAIRGLDFMNNDFAGCVKRAKEWWERGGLVSICWHCGADFNGSWAQSQNTEIDWDKALVEGTPEYEAMIKGIDKAAQSLLELQEAGVTVLWRPYHEFDGAWFWWGKGGAENFKTLWKIMYDRYTNHWKLNNLIWVYGYSHKISKDWYVGDEYVDVVGADCYDGGIQHVRYSRVKSYAMDGTPICYHENGEIPNPDDLIKKDVQWVWFMTWHTQHITDSEFNTPESIKHAYTHDYVITLDELPDFTA